MKTGQEFNPYGMFNGSFIPEWLMRNEDLSSTAKLVYARLARYAGADGKAFPSQDALGEAIGRSKPRVWKAIKLLRDYGLIRVDRPTGKDRLMHKTARYRFIWHECIENALSTPNSGGNAGELGNDHSGELGNDHSGELGNEDSNVRQSGSKDSQGTASSSSGKNSDRDSGNKGEENAAEDYDSIRDALRSEGKNGKVVESYLSIGAEQRLTEIIDKDNFEGMMTRLREFVGLIRSTKDLTDEHMTRVRGQVLRETFGNPEFAGAILTCSAHDLNEKLRAFAQGYDPSRGSAGAYWSHKVGDLVRDSSEANALASEVHQEVKEEKFEEDEKKRADDVKMLTSLRGVMQNKGGQAWNINYIRGYVDTEDIDVLALKMGLVLLSDDRPSFVPADTACLGYLVEHLAKIGESIDLSEDMVSSIDEIGASEGIENACDMISSMNYRDWMRICGLDYLIEYLDGSISELPGRRNAEKLVWKHQP